MSRSCTFRRLSVAAALAFTLLAGGMSAAVAQEQDSSHPSHIHAGTCDDLDPNPVLPLNNIGPIELSDEHEASEPVGVLSASPVLSAETETKQLSWDELFSSAYSIVVHESDANLQTYIACGEIGGRIKDDELVLALHPMNDSGYSGIAFVEKDNEYFDVEIFLIGPRTDDATPSS